MRDTLDLTPPQRTPVIRGTAVGRATPGGAEQSYAWGPWASLEDGAEQSMVWQPPVPFEGGAEQSIYGGQFVPLEEGAEQSWNMPWPFE